MKKMIEIVFPKDTQEGSQNFLSRWLKKVGDAVSLHEPIAEISTDKVSIEITSPANGIIESIAATENKQIEPGEVLGIIRISESLNAEQGEASAFLKPSIEIASNSSLLSPAVKKLLREHNLDASNVAGTGKEGRITPEDILKHLSLSTDTGSLSKKIPHTPIRRTTAHHLTQSLLHTAPHVTTVFECDLTNVIQHKEELKSQGHQITLTAYFIHALSRAVKFVPEVNSRWFPEHLEIFDSVHVGVGVSTPENELLVPVLRDVQGKTLLRIGEDLRSLAEKAREKKLLKEDLSGSTITISNYGSTGGLFATPIIINQPESAIVGIGAIEKRAKVVVQDNSEQIQVRSMCYITLTLDHRVLDGFRANEFLRVMKGNLEVV